ncbi:hypothetical protein [Mycobacterium sp.]|uniref:hypothetical protein n=1 Tax=Mycobacterium sp. TaxID=1785 RepID=UPI003BAA95E2
MSVLQRWISPNGAQAGLDGGPDATPKRASGETFGMGDPRGRGQDDIPDWHWL